MKHQTLMDTLAMKYETVTKEKIEISMPVTKKVTQPMGYLHGGATAALAETAASLGGMQHVDSEKQAIVGIEINCNHLKAKKQGVVTAIAQPLHLGKRTMVWDIQIIDEDRLCLSRYIHREDSSSLYPVV